MKLGIKPLSAYAMAGVNVTLGDQFSAFCGEICRASYENSKFVEVHDYSKGHFRGQRGWELMNLPKGYIQTAGSDGIGTKVIISDAAGMYRKSPRDLIGMTAGDFTRYGSMPLVFLNHLDVATLGKDNKHTTFTAAKSLMIGLCEVASEESYVLFNGETAELRDCVTSENPDAVLKYNWGGVMFGVMHPLKRITGELIQEGDRVMALRDTVRSNGISLIRSGLRHRYGENWYANTTQEAQAAIKQAAKPSVLYDKFLVDINGWTRKGFKAVVKAHLIAHLSGGGIQSKLGEDLLFRMGWSADLDNLWIPPKVMRNCATDLKVPDHECYKSWGCGQGALVVIAAEDEPLFMQEANAWGIQARNAGSIKKTEAGKSPYILVKSGFTGDTFMLEPEK